MNEPKLNFSLKAADIRPGAACLLPIERAFRVKARMPFYHENPPEFGVTQGMGGLEVSIAIPINISYTFSP